MVASYYTHAQVYTILYYTCPWSQLSLLYYSQTLVYPVPSSCVHTDISWIPPTTSGSMSCFSPKFWKERYVTTTTTDNNTQWKKLHHKPPSLIHAGRASRLPPWFISTKSITLRYFLKLSDLSLSGNNFKTWSKEYQLDQINIYPIGNIEANYEESIQSPVGNISTTVIFMVQSIYIVSITVCKMAIAIFVETPRVSLHKSNPQSLLCKLGNVS